MARDYKDISGKNNANFKHGLGRHPIINSWTKMRQRCSNPNDPKYNRYGGRGITVCDEWNNSSVFIKWAIESGWKKGMCIDRIDNDKGYNPENCQWLTVSDNSRKKSTTKLSIEQARDIRIRIQNGENERDLAKEFGVVHGTIWFIKNKFTHVPNGECTIKLKERNK